MYTLADGSTSDQYKIGDKFVVEDGLTFSKGSVVSLFSETHLASPIFKLEQGECQFTCAEGGKGAFCTWEFVSKYLEDEDEPSLTPFQKAGYTKDTVFRVGPCPGYYSAHPEGTLVKLHEDDNSNCPAFTSLDNDGNIVYYAFHELGVVHQVSNPKGLGTQIDGEHYLEMKMQPVQLAYPLGATPCFTKLAKYLTRNKGERIVNLEKALHVIELERDIGVVDMYAEVWGDDREAVNKLRNHLCKFTTKLYVYNALWTMYIRDYDSAKFWVDKIIEEEQNGKLEN